MVRAAQSPNLGATSEDRLAIALARIEKERDQKRAQQNPGGQKPGANGPSTAGQDPGGANASGTRTQPRTPEGTSERSGKSGQAQQSGSPLIPDSYAAAQSSPQSPARRDLQRVPTETAPSVPAPSNGASQLAHQSRLDEHVSGLDRRRSLEPGDPARARPTGSTTAQAAPTQTGGPGSIKELAAPDLQSRIDDLNGRANQLQQRVESYGEVQDWIAGHNLQQVQGMADEASQRATRNPFPLPGNWDKMSASDRDKLRQVNQETVRQMREDLRAGRSSAMLDPTELQNISSGTEARAQLRFNQLLQDNDIPKDFGDHSPTTMRDLEGLDKINEGQLPDMKDGPASSDAISSYLGRMSESRSNAAIERMVKTGKVPPGMGLERGVPNAKDIPTEMAALQKERDALNKDLEKIGRSPIELEGLKSSQERLQKLDQAITDYGKQLDERLGKRGDYDRNTTPTEGPGTLSDQQKDELVRANDSLNLLRQNRSGLSLKDVPMSPKTKEAIGLPAWIQPDQRIGQRHMPDVFKKPEDRLSPTEKIDHAALLPREQRDSYLKGLNSEIYGDSAGEKYRTEGLSKMDNTFLNRAAEALDPTSYIFNRNKTDWIGPRAQLRGEQANNIHHKISGLTDKAGSNIIDGQFGQAMEKMRQTVSPLGFHKNFNGQYERQNDESNMRTAMTLATLPLSALPIARAGLSGGRAVARSGARMLSGSGRRIAASMARAAPLGSTRRQLARALGNHLRSIKPTNLADDLARSGRIAPLRNGRLAPSQGTRTGPRMTAAERVKGGPRAGTGGRFGVDEPGFVNAGHNLEDVEGLRQGLMRRNDIGAVQKDLRRMGVKADRELLDAVKKYNFDSPGLSFYQDNHAAWNRLAQGKGTVADAQYVAHEMAEVKTLRKIQQQTGFDFMGKNYANMTERQARAWQHQFREHYLSAHRQALGAEYDFLANQVKQATGGRVNVGRNVAAANDPTRSEALDWMMQDGVPLRQHRQFGQWASRGDELVDLSSGARKNLGFSRDTRVTLSELIRRVKHRPAGGF